MREAIFPLVLCLVAWFAFDLLEGQRDIARSERDAALFEVTGLREAARVSGEMLAERDAIDLQRTQELNDERTENDGLRLAVRAGLKRLQLNATCSVPASGTHVENVNIHTGKPMNPLELEGMLAMAVGG